MRQLVFALLVVAGCGSVTTRGQDVGISSDDGGTDAPTPLRDVGWYPSVRVADVSDLVVSGNCEPIAPADPIAVSWTLRAEAHLPTGNSVVLTSATLHLVAASGATFDQTLVVDPSTFSFGGRVGTTTQSKTSGMPEPTNACGTLCDAQATLELVYLADRVSTHATLHGTVGCAF